jgi:hypothetical protein
LVKKSWLFGFFADIRTLDSGDVSFIFVNGCSQKRNTPGAKSPDVFFRRIINSQSGPDGVQAPISAEVLLNG